MRKRSEYQRNLQLLHRERFAAGKLRWTKTAREILRQVSVDHMVGVVDIRGTLRLPHLISARQDAVHRMRAAGLIVNQCAAAIGKDHSTISHYLYPKLRTRKLQYMREARARASAESRAA